MLLDVIFLIATAAFFGIGILYALGCERVRRGETHERE